MGDAMTPELLKAFCQFQAEVGPIHKNSMGQHSRYADLQAVLGVVLPVLTKHGLMLMQPLEGNQLHTVLWHEAGGSMTFTLDLIVGQGKNPLHTWGAAVTYQRRYAILSLLGLATEDNDGDGVGHKMKGPATASTTDDDFI